MNTVNVSDFLHIFNDFLFLTKTAHARWLGSFEMCQILKSDQCSVLSEELFQQ